MPILAQARVLVQPGVVDLRVLLAPRQPFGRERHLPAAVRNRPAGVEYNPLALRTRRAPAIAPLAAADLTRPGGPAREIDIEQRDFASPRHADGSDEKRQRARPKDGMAAHRLV